MNEWMNEEAINYNNFGTMNRSERLYISFIDELIDCDQG